jgi:hypothetical protein
MPLPAAYALAAGQPLIALDNSFGAKYNKRKGDTMSGTYAVQDQFADGEVDLKKLYRLIGKEQKTAIETLVGLCASNDENIKMKAAKALLDLSVELGTKINAEQLQRLVASHRLGVGQQRLTEISGPTYDFDTIQEV